MNCMLLRLQYLTSCSRAYLSRAGVQATSFAATKVESIITFKHCWCFSYSWLTAERSRDSRTSLTNEVSRAMNCDSSPSPNSLMSHIASAAGWSSNWGTELIDSRSPATLNAVSVSVLSGLEDKKPRLDNWRWMTGDARLSNVSTSSPLFSGTSLPSDIFTKNTATWLLVCTIRCRKLKSWSQHNKHKHKHEFTT